MNRRKLPLPVGLALALGAPALAQDGPEATPVGASTSADQLAQARGAVESIRGHATYVEGLLKKARDANDEAAMTCLTPRAATLRALVEISEGALFSAQEALAEGEDGRAGLELRKIEVARSRGQALRAEAEVCVNPDAQAPPIVDPRYDGDDEGEDIDAANVDIGDDPPGTSSFE
ncbi:MAG: hypothetical protein H6739_31065 [Alphaproteobacteria bacterium]|nr:hypothetical protein [Alphaproteobacteria bacterium]